MAENEKPNSEWIITPGLSGIVDNFIKLYEHLKSKSGRKFPIMILGERGVGKSLFLHIYRTLYEKDNKKAKPKMVIKKINVAAIPKDLVEDMLFGHVRGAFTGADSDKWGIVHETNLLIMEEIGELLDSVQAKLLTFLEDGEYYRVGETNPQKANADLQIIATTNKKREFMRQDFYDRFIKFTVPPLYQRREDVLYYIHHLSSGLLKSFRPWEILTLLAYHWPGNVREVLNSCLDMELFLLKREKDPRLKEKPPISFVEVKKDHTSLTWGNCYKLIRKLNKADIDSKLLERTLNEYGVGIDPFNNMKKPLANEKDKGVPNKEELTWDENLEAWVLQINNKFAKTYDGLRLYCDLFYKSLNDPTDLLVENPYAITIIPDNPFKHIQKPKSTHDRLVKDILECIFKIKISSSLKDQYLVDMDNDKYRTWFFNAFGSAINETDSDGLSGGKKAIGHENLFDMTKDDLLRAYCQYLLKKARTIEDAANLAGMNKNTFYSMLKKSGIV